MSIWNCVKTTFKFVWGLLDILVLYPIASIISFPKVTKIFLDKDIQLRHLTPLNDIVFFRRLLSLCCAPQYFHRPTEPSLNRMKNLVLAKYKISITYLRGQIVYYTMGFCVFAASGILTPILLALDDMGTTTPSYFMAQTSLYILKSTSIYLYVSNVLSSCYYCFWEDYARSVRDEIFAVCQCFRKSMKRNLDPEILQANIELNNLTGINVMLSHFSRPRLNQELTHWATYIKETQIALEQLNLLPGINNLILEYAYPNSLIFSAGNRIPLARFEKFDSKYFWDEETSEQHIDENSLRKIHSEEKFLQEVHLPIRLCSDVSGY